MLEMTLQETMAILTLACKSAEMFEMWEKGIVAGAVEQAQVLAARDNALKVLRRLDADNPGMLPLPHDGVGWKDRP